MPRHQESMKDATNGETPRGVVCTQRSGGIRMGEPNNGNALLHLTEYIGYLRQRRELKHLSTCRKRKQ